MASFDGFQTSWDGNITWTVTDFVGLAPATHFIQAAQPQNQISCGMLVSSYMPQNLIVDISREVINYQDLAALQQFCKAVHDNFTGDLILKLWGSYLNYEICDTIVDLLQNSR